MSYAKFYVLWGFVAVILVMGQSTKLGDYVPPHCSPKVPRLVTHCLREIEGRDENLLQVYRDAAVCNAQMISCMKRKYLTTKYEPNYAKMTSADICQLLSEFLQNLGENVVPSERLPSFSAALADPSDKSGKLRKVITSLPIAHRDTLSALLLHVQKLQKEMDLEVSDLALFAPIVFGFQGNFVENLDILKGLLQLNEEFYSQILKSPVNLNSSPFGGSLLRSTGELFESFKSTCRKVAQQYQAIVADTSLPGKFNRLNLRR